MNFKFLFFLCLSTCLMYFASCTHEPTLAIDEEKEDTIKPPILIGGTIDSSGTPCDANQVYFEKDVFPIIKQSCAISGCHAAGTYREGVNLETYAKIISTGDVKPGDASASDLHKVIVSTKPGDVMPPPPAPALTTDQINIITKWINQGAKNNTCNPNYGKPLGCDTSNVSFSKVISPIIQVECSGCHNNTTTYGGIKLNSHQTIKDATANGLLLGTILWSPGYSKMPEGRAQLNTCAIDQLKKWIRNGAKND